MQIKSPIAAAFVLVTASAVSSGEPRISASLSGLADDENGRSLDFDAAIAPDHRWEIGAGIGSTESRSAAGALDGTSLRLFADVHGERFGLRGSYRSWNSNGLDTDAVGGRAYFRNGGLTLSLTGEAQGIDLDYDDGSTTPQRSTARFSGTGWGGGLSYQWSSWNAYAEGMSYRYGSLSRYVETQGVQAPPSSSPTTPVAPSVPTLPGLPILPVPPPVVPGAPLPSSLLPLPESVAYVLPTLAGSFVTLNQGVFEHLLSAGIERGFTRSSVRVSWTGARDAVLDTDINSFSAGYRYSFTDRLNASVTLGVSDSSYGSVNFGGVSFGLNL
jgi:hypothetical protein